MSMFGQTKQQLDKFIMFCEKITQLSDQGIDFLSALHIVYDDEEDRVFKERISRFKTALDHGGIMTDHLGALLPAQIPFTLNGIRQAPQLTLFFRKLSAYYRFKSKAISEIKKQCRYPLILLSIALILFILFLFVLLPSYDDVFGTMLNTYPTLLRVLLDISDMMNVHGIMVLFFMVLILGLAGQLLRFSFVGWVSRVLFPFRLSDYFWIMAVLLESGFSLKESLGCIDIKQRQTFQIRVSQAIHLFYQTGNLAESFHHYFKLSAYQRACLVNGEKNGALATSLNAVVMDIEEKEASRFQASLLWIQPVLLSVMGALIFFFLYVTFIPVMLGLESG